MQLSSGQNLLGETCTGTGGVFRRSQMPAGISECILKRTCDYGTAGNRDFSCVPRTWPLTPELTAECFLEAQPIFERQAAIWQNVLEDRADNGELEELDGFINNTSIRLRLICKETAVELPGDMYADCWEKHEIPPCTLVKLPHHGHRDSITPHLLGYAGPEDGCDLCLQHPYR